MVKKSAPLLEVERLLDLVPFLSVNPYITLKELSKEFGVTEREMSNELVALSMCGLPGYTPYELIEVSFESGYVSINNHQSLDLPRALSSAEISAFLLGLNIIKDSLENDSSNMRQVDSLIARLNSLLDTPIAVELDSSAHFLGDIEIAITRRSTLTLKYLSSADSESKIRQVAPLALRREGAHIYLEAYCLTSQAHRNFRLDRVEELSLDRAPSKNLVIPADVPNNPEAVPRKIKIKIHRNRRRYSELLNIESIPASGIIEISVFSEQWLVRAISAAQGDIEILSGADIGSEIVARSTQILALYQS